MLDIFTEPEPDSDTLSNLGPLRAMAGIWTSADGLDVNPKAAGPELQPYIERMELQPIDAQTNGPQLYYGLRYHTYIIKPDEIETLHDQVGYWLWEPATADAKSFSLEAVRGSTVNGICSAPFLEYAFRTERYAITITIHDDGTWSYEQQTTLIVRGQAEQFQHTDRARLKRIAAPTPNPTARART